MPKRDIGRLNINFPILQGILPIKASQISAEIVAGMTLAALAIPEVMGYTKISGTPVVTGLYTIFIPMALFSIFGSSRHLVVGADSATAAILAAGLSGIAAIGSDQYVALAGVLALMAAGCLLLARLIGLGFMADFLSRTVLIGFLSGIGVQVALGEVSGMLGLEGGSHGTIGELWNDFQQIDHVNTYSMAISGTVLTVMIGLKRLSRSIPGALIAVIGVTFASWLMDFKNHVQVLGIVPSGLPRVGLPQIGWNLQLLEKLAPTAFAMFVVILAQSAATSRAYAARYNEVFSENTDLVGLALANVGAGLSGTFVVNGSPTKTQMVDSAGGHSQLSSLVTTLIVSLVLLFLTEPLAYLPDAALASIVFMIGLELIDSKGMANIYTQRQSEFWIALITSVMVISVGVEQGIILAIVLSLIDHTRRGYHPSSSVLVPTPSGALHARPVKSKAQALEGLIIYRFAHSMYYANAQKLTEELSYLGNNSEPTLRWLCIDASTVDDIDYSASEALRALYFLLKSRGIRLVFANVLDELRKTCTGLAELLGEDAFYGTLTDVIKDYNRYKSKELKQDISTI